MSRRNEPSLFELLAKLPAQLSALIKLEYENAKREIAARLRMLGLGALVLLIASFMLFFVLAALVTAAIAGIAVALPVWAAALIVAAGLLLLTGGLIWFGVSRVQRGNPIPEETLGRLESDFEHLAERGASDEDEF